MSNIIVLVKQVPDTNARIVLSGDRVDLSAVKKVMSPYDEFAVETALQHREANGGEVTAITVGDAGADKVLKDAKAIGVDHIVRIDCNEALDSNALQSVLAEAVKNMNATVVYCGKSAADTGAGSTGPGLAEWRWLQGQCHKPENPKEPNAMDIGSWGGVIVQIDN